MKKHAAFEDTLAINVHRIPFDGSGDKLPTKDVVGSKAHNLMRIARRDLPIPPAFVLSTNVCRDYLKRGKAALEGLDAVLDRELDQLGKLAGRHFGDASCPLLVSVRSGAAISMPGMMETVLNIGLDDATLSGLIRMTGNPRLAHDCRRRLVQQYGEVVHGLAPTLFENRQRALLIERGLSDVDEIDSTGLRDIGDAELKVFETAAGCSFPSKPQSQLHAAVEAVLRSWSSERARDYRKLNGIPDDLGTAVIVQAMVYGNWGPSSGSGVGFTRNPGDGGNELYVDYLANAQGEDVVGGRRRAMGLDELERRAPDAHRSLLAARPILEQEFADMQDFEFTVEEGRLFFLQCRAGKRTPLAALRIAHDLVVERIIAPIDALQRLDGLELDEIEIVRLKPSKGQTPLLRGTPASTGIAIGAVVFDPERLPAIVNGGTSAILVRESAETGDILALSEAAALIAVEGARTSHAAVVARQLGKVCVVGCAGLTIDESGQSGEVGSEKLHEGDMITVDGATGAIFRGELEVVRERPVELLQAIAGWRTASSAEGRTPQPRARKKT